MMLGQPSAEVSRGVTAITSAVLQLLCARKTVEVFVNHAEDGPRGLSQLLQLAMVAVDKLTAATIRS